jgi:hypothetical protein
VDGHNAITDAGELGFERAGPGQRLCMGRERQVVDTEVGQPDTKHELPGPPAHTPRPGCEGPAGRESALAVLALGR